MQDGYPVAYASRSLTPTEVQYAQIEKELLAIVFGMEKFETYLYGRKVLVGSDHKPLEAIFKKSFLNAPKRLQQMLLRFQRYEFEVSYKKGTSFLMADPLSRAYLLQNLIQNLSQEDAILKTLACIIKQGWPKVNFISHWKFKTTFHSDKNLHSKMELFSKETVLSYR